MKIKMSYVLYIFSILFLSVTSLTAQSWMDWFWKKQDTKQLREGLELKQIHDPTNPYVNYNLGVASYKSKDFLDAWKNFDLACQHAKHADLKKRSYFNAGKSLYQTALSKLGKDWESGKVDDKILDESINYVQQGIERYKNVLVLDVDHDRAKTGLQESEELLAKLYEKKRWQHEKQPEQNKDQVNKDQDKKNNNQGQSNNKEQTGGSKEQDANNEGSGSEEQDASSGKNKNADKQKNNSEDKSNNQKNNGDTNKERANHSEQLNNQQDKEQPRNTHEKPEAGDDGQSSDQKKSKIDEQAANKPGNTTEQEEQEEQEITDSLDKQDSQDKNSIEKQVEGQHLEAANNQIDDGKRRHFNAVLNNLDVNESKKQRELLRFNSQKQGAAGSKLSQQKPW